MRLLLIPLFFAMAQGLDATNCSAVCPKNLSYHCGFTPGCNVEAGNLCHMDYEVCRRAESELPPFDKIAPGRCPWDKLSCPFARFPFLSKQSKLTIQ